MGLIRARAKTPTKILELSGTWRSKVRKGEVEGTDGTPEPMDCVTRDPLASEIFARLLVTIGEMNILKKQDGIYLSMLALNLAVLERPLDETGVNERKDAQAFIVKLGCQFGMSPSARAGLMPNPKPKTATDDPASLLKLAP